MHVFFYTLFFTLIGISRINASITTNHNNEGYPEYLQGVITPLVTPYLNDAQQNVDSIAYAHLTSYVADHHVSAIFAVCPIGQWNKLSLGEEERLIKTTLDAIPRTVPVLIGVSGRDDIIQILQLIQTAEDVGANGIVVAIPSYITAENVILSYIHKIASSVSSNIDIVIDDCYGVLTPKNLKLLLSANQNIKGIIISSLKDAAYTSQMATAAHRQCAILIREESAVDQAFRHGAVGVISSGAIIYPGLMNSLVRACENNDWEKAQQLQIKATAGWKFLNSFGNPAPTIKTILNDVIGIRMYPADRGTTHYSNIHFSKNDLHLISNLINNN